MKKYIVFCLISILFSYSYGQINSIGGNRGNSNRVIKYSVIRDAPEYANNLNIIMFAPYFHYSRTGKSLGLGGGINFNLKNFVALEFLLKKGLVSFPLKDPENFKGNITPAGNKSSMLHLDVVFDFTFAKHISDRKKLLWNGEISFKQMFRFGIRAGYQYLSSPYDMNNYNMKGYDINSAIKTEADLSQDGYTRFMGSNHIVSLGFSAKRTSNFIIQIEDKKGENSFQRLDEAYIEVLFSPSARFGDINRVDSTNFGPLNQTIINTYHITDAGMQKWGFRMGYMHYPLNVFNWCYGAEMGIMPGPGSNTFENLYILVKVGILFSANVFNRP